MSQAFSVPVSGVTKLGELYGIIANAQNALRSCFSGAAFPASPVQGQACFRTDTLRFYIYSGSTWVDFTDYLPVFKAIKTEVESARGLAASLDARLNVAINRDGTLKGDAPASSWWTDEADTIAYADASSFTVAGDKTAIYTVNRAVSLNQTTDAVGRVTGASYSAGTGLTTVTVDCAVDAGLTGVAYGQPVDNYPAHQHAAGDLTSLPEHQHGASDLTSLPTHQHGATDLTSLPSHTHGGADLTSLEGWLAGIGAASTAARSDHYHPAAVVSEYRAAGTHGGSCTASTWHTRALNTVESDPLGIVSVSSNRLILAPGKYLLRGAAISWGSSTGAGGGHIVRFYDYNSSAYRGFTGGLTSRISNGGENSIAMTAAIVEPESTTAFELRHYTTFTQATYGLGYGVPGIREVFAMVEIFLLS